MTISRKILILVAFPLTIGTALLLILGFMLFEAEQQTRREAYTNQIKSGIEKIGILGSFSLSCLTMFSLTHDPSYASQYAAVSKQLQEQFNLLEQLCKPDPAMLRQEQKFRETVTRDSASMAALQKDLAYNSEKPASGFGMLDVRDAAKKIKSVIHEQLEAGELFASAAASEKPSTGISARRWTEMIELLLVFGLIANVIASVLLARILSGNIVVRLNALVDNSIRLGTGLPIKPRLGGTDEIARVDNVFHKMADELQAASLRERAIVDNAVDVICSLDQNGQFTAVNLASAKVLGYQPADLLSRNIADIVIDEDKQATRSSLELAAKQESMSLFEARCHNQNEQITHILWSVRWSAPEQSYFCVAHDITERKLAEALLKESEASIRLILEGMPIGLLVSNDRGMIEITNMRSALMFGYEHEDMITKPLSLLFDASLEPKLSTFVSGKQTDIKPAELTAIKKDGETFTAEISFADLSFHGERKILAVVFDISKRKEVERLKKEFVSMVSHDLRSPLMSIQGTFSLLLSGQFIALDDRSQACLSASESASGQLIELINGLLDIEKLESGEMRLQNQFVDIGSVISRSVSSVGSLAQQQGVEISIDTDSGKCFGDSSKIVQVLVNLLANAVRRSTPQSQVTISARIDGAMVELKVSDNGPIISPAQAQEIFDKFKTVSSSAAASSTNSGLGLAICKAIIEAHDGTMTVESHPTVNGATTTFAFRIFCQPRDGAAIESPQRFDVN